MPVTKTAKRALRSSKRKEGVNKVIAAKLDLAIKKVKKVFSKESLSNVASIADVAAKKGLIHKNKAARIKSRLSKLAAK